MTPKETFLSATSGPWRTAGDDVQYRIADDSEAIRLYFQCTVSESDWLHNFDVAIEPYRAMPCSWAAHRGFVRLWRSVRDGLLSEVEALLAARARPITVAGYSQGAALATLAHEDIGFNVLGSVVRGAGFGTPRVVWGWLTDDRRWAAFHRWNVRGDIVSALPPSAMGYRHVGVRHDLGTFAFPSAERHKPEYYEQWLP